MDGWPSLLIQRDWLRKKIFFKKGKKDEKGKKMMRMNE
jgi:hypothetical protein